MHRVHFLRGLLMRPLPVGFTATKVLPYNKLWKQHFCNTLCLKKKNTSGNANRHTLPGASLLPTVRDPPFKGRYINVNLAFTSCTRTSKTSRARWLGNFSDLYLERGQLAGTPTILANAFSGVPQVSHVFPPK
jgi:hypothetical protein